jgi:hypothetical protein
MYIAAQFPRDSAEIVQQRMIQYHAAAGSIARFVGHR